MLKYKEKKKQWGWGSCVWGSEPPPHRYWVWGSTASSSNGVRRKALENRRRAPENGNLVQLETSKFATEMPYGHAFCVIIIRHYNYYNAL